MSLCTCGHRKEQHTLGCGSCYALFADGKICLCAKFLDATTIVRLALTERLDLIQHAKEAMAARSAAINPDHYKSDPSGVECIQITRHRNFNIGNAIKYLWRAGLKNGEATRTEDLEKALWYIKDELGLITGSGEHAGQQINMRQSMQQEGLIK